MTGHCGGVCQINSQPCKVQKLAPLKFNYMTTLLFYILIRQLEQNITIGSKGIQMEDKCSGEVYVSVQEGILSVPCFDLNLSTVPQGGHHRQHFILRRNLSYLLNV